MIPDISPRQAFDLVVSDERAVLVDVRTRSEWSYVGVPDLAAAGRQVVLIEWNRAEGGRNDAFLEQLRAAVPDRSARLAFICRSGQRSRSAAEAALTAGYESVANVAEGFEGDLDTSGHRGTTGGWKAAGLPWRQT